MSASVQFKRLDVRERIRAGVEVFSLIHGRVSQLRFGEGIVVVAPFLPSPLIERLGGEGFASRIERGSGSDWLVYFWRDPD